MNLVHEYVRSIFLEFVYDQDRNDLLVDQPILEKLPAVKDNHEEIRSRLSGECISIKDLMSNFKVMLEEDPDKQMCSASVMDHIGDWWDIELQVEILAASISFIKISVIKDNLD